MARRVYIFLVTFRLQEKERQLHQKVNLAENKAWYKKTELSVGLGISFGCLIPNTKVIIPRFYTLKVGARSDLEVFLLCHTLVRIRVWHSYGFWYERISEYIRVKKNEIFWDEYIHIKILIRTNIRMNIWIGYIRIFEYIRHSQD